MSSTKTFLVGGQTLGFDGHHHYFVDTSVGQPIILYIAAMGNIDNSLVEAARVDECDRISSFLENQNGQAYCQQPLYIAIITTINSFQCFAFDPIVDIGGPLTTSTSTLLCTFYLYGKAFKLSLNMVHANTMGVLLAVIIAIISFAQFKILRKRRRILKKGASDENQHKRNPSLPLSDFNDHFAPFDSLVHFPILLDFDRGL